MHTSQWICEKEIVFVFVVGDSYFYWKQVGIQIYLFIGTLSF